MPASRRLTGGRGDGRWYAERVISVKGEYELSVDPAARDGHEVSAAPAEHPGRA